MHEAIVLAGGYGTRLRSVVADVPKPMAPVAGRPFLEWQLELLAERGFGRAVLAIGHLGTVISGHFGDRFAGLDIAYAAEEEPLGTGGAIRHAIGLCRRDRIFVFNGDTYLDVDPGAIDRLWLEDRRGVIVGREVPDASRYGALRLENGWVTGMAEKAQAGPGVVNAGCYLIAADLFRTFTAPRAFSFERDYLAPTLPATPFHCALATGSFIDIGVPEDYARAQLLLPGTATDGFRPPRP